MEDPKIINVYETKNPVDQNFRQHLSFFPYLIHFHFYRILYDKKGRISHRKELINEEPNNFRTPIKVFKSFLTKTV